MQAQDSAEPYEGSELFKLRHTAAHVMAQAVLDPVSYTHLTLPTSDLV